MNAPSQHDFGWDGGGGGRSNPFFNGHFPMIFFLFTRHTSTVRAINPVKRLNLHLSNEKRGPCPVIWGSFHKQL